MDDTIGIEDIDTCGATMDRDTKNKKVTKSDKDDFSFLTLSGLLNGIDGVSSGDDRILIATTNHPEKLDKALIREGRFDLHLEIGYVNDEMLKEFITRFYPGHKIPKSFKIKPKVAPCEVQGLIFKNRDNPKEVLKSLDKKRKSVRRSKK